VGFVEDKVELRQVFHLIFRGFSVNFHSTKSPYSSIQHAGIRAVPLEAACRRETYFPLTTRRKKENIV